MAEGFGKKQIWNVFFVLLAITVAEFILALGFPETAAEAENSWNPIVVNRMIKNALYGIMTIAKAFYIVAYFMHLKFERMNLIYSILLPIIFILGIIAALIYEADYWNILRAAEKSEQAMLLFFQK